MSRPMTRHIVFLFFLLIVRTSFAADWLQLTEQAESLYKQGNNEQALQVAQQAFLLGKKDSFNEIIIYRSVVLGLILKSLRQYKEVQELYGVLLPVWEKRYGKDSPYFVTALANLGWAHNKQGRFAEAESHLVEVVRLAETHGMVMFVNGARIDLADFYAEQGAYAKAEELYFKGMSPQTIMGDERPDHGNMTNVKVKLGKMYEKQGFFDRAETMYTEALSHTESFYGNHRNRYRTERMREILLLLSSVFEKSGKVKEANAAKKRLDSIQ